MASSQEYVRDTVSSVILLQRHLLDIALMAPVMANLADEVSEIGLRMGIGLTLSGYYPSTSSTFGRLTFS